MNTFICTSCHKYSHSAARLESLRDNSCPYSGCKGTVVEELHLTFKGYDNWDRPVYESEYGKLYVDTDPRSHREPDICTKSGNEFNGEPDTPISENIKVKFTPHRIVWK